MSWNSILSIILEPSEISPSKPVLESVTAHDTATVQLVVTNQVVVVIVVVPVIVTPVYVTVEPVVGVTIGVIGSSSE